MFVTSATSNVLIQSYGYDGGTNAHGLVFPAGGFDPVVSVFRGTGPGAVFVDLNDDACMGCPDSLLQLLDLPAGTYTMALTVYANYPWAGWDPVNYSTLGDGFIGLGSQGTRSADFAVDITSDALVIVPEPATLLLGATALVVALGLRKRLPVRPGQGR